MLKMSKILKNYKQMILIIIHLMFKKNYNKINSK